MSRFAASYESAFVGNVPQLYRFSESRPHYAAATLIACA
jgi:hypothetical protein